MVLESFLTPTEARRNNWTLFFIGVIYSSLGVLLSLIIFPEQASIFTIFFTTIATSPLFVQLLKDEEGLNIQFLKEKRPIFKNNLNILGVFFFIFLGFTVSFSWWFSFLPEWALNKVFSHQINDINAVRTIVSGAVSMDGLFLTILANNLRVLFFCFLFSFIFGAGAVFILCWNASVLGSAVGLFLRQRIVELTGSDYFSGMSVYLTSLPYGLGQYMFHGVFEILAYFMASLAGGVISAAVVRKHYKSKGFLDLIKNTGLLVIGGVLFLTIAAFIEVNL